MASLCGVMITTMSSAFRAAARFGRSANGTATIATRARMMSQRFMGARASRPHHAICGRDARAPGRRLAGSVSLAQHDDVVRFHARVNLAPRGLVDEPRIQFE